MCKHTFVLFSLFDAYISNRERRGEHLKKVKIIYLTAFLFGVIGTNILESKAWIHVACLNRYQLLQLSYSEIRYESYFIELFMLRLQTVVLLWLLEKVISPKWVRYLFGGILCVMLGSVLTCSILANGVWGLLLFCGILFPQWIFYLGAYMWWGGFCSVNSTRYDKNKKFMQGMILILFVILGCVTEAYINPAVFKTMIKI